MYNLEAEKAVISAALNNIGIVSVVNLKAHQFHSEFHQTIWGGLIELSESGRDIAALVHLSDVIPNLNLEALTDIGMERGINHIEDAKLINKLSYKREIRGILNRAAGSLNETNPSEVIEGVLFDLKEIQDTDSKGTTLVTAVETCIQTIESGIVTPRINTMNDIDYYLEGLQAGKLYVIAARPGVGKSAFALDLAKRAIKQQRKVHFWSLEMSPESIGERYVASEVRQSNPTKADMPDLQRSLDELKGYAVGKVFDKGKTVHDISAEARKDRPGLIVVDYLQLMTGEGQIREQQISSISRGLKAISMEFGIPVVALSQLNRSLESRDDKRPQLSDLRESGAIEQDADTVIMMYRDSYYDNNQAGGLELLFRKNRGGKLGKADIYYDPSIHYFSQVTYQ